MENYRIEFKQSVEKDLKRLPAKDRIRILRRIAPLKDNPRPEGCRKLSGQERYRLRQGAYRILYEIADRRLIVVVVKIGNRKDVYR
jgi:mRNA interferase RelE/StbE